MNMIDIITSINENIAILLVCVLKDDNNYNYRVTSLASWKDISLTTPAPLSTTPLPRYKKLSTKNYHDSVLNTRTNILICMDYNDAIQACRDMVKEWDRRDASRRKALSQLQTKSPLPHASRFGGHPIKKNSPASRRPTIEN